MLLLCTTPNYQQSSWESTHTAVYCTVVLERGVSSRVPGYLLVCCCNPSRQYLLDNPSGNRTQPRANSKNQTSCQHPSSLHFNPPFITMTSMYDEPKASEISLPPYPHSERGSEVRTFLVASRRSVFLSAVEIPICLSIGGIFT